jgi:hypothetical protein
MVVAIDEVSHRNLEALRDLVLEPGRCLGIDRIADNHPLRRDQEPRVVLVVLKLVEIASDLRNHAIWLGRRLRRPLLRERGASHRNCHQYASA